MTLVSFQSTKGSEEAGQVQERRRALRKETKIGFQFLVRSRDGEWIVDPFKVNEKSYISDISTGGVGIFTTLPLNVGQEILVATIGGHFAFKARLKLVNFRRTKVGLFHYGCQFLECTHLNAHG